MCFRGAVFNTRNDTLMMHEVIATPNECVKGKFVKNYSPLDHALERLQSPALRLYVSHSPPTVFGIGEQMPFANRSFRLGLATKAD
jgi:hypothetical protein